VRDRALEDEVVRGAARRSIGAIAGLSLILSAALVPLPRSAVAQAATPAPTTGPSLAWERAVDVTGSPMLGDGAMTPLAIDAGQTGLVLATARRVSRAIDPDAMLWSVGLDESGGLRDVGRSGA
jgi:hypothetical protein